MNLKREFVHRVQRFVVNPIGRQLPMTMLETIGRKTGQPRRTAVGGRVVDNQFWMVSEHGEHSDYVYNIKPTPPCGSASAADGAVGPPTCYPTTIRGSGCAAYPG